MKKEKKKKKRKKKEKNPKPQQNRPLMYQKGELKNPSQPQTWLDNPWKKHYITFCWREVKKKKKIKENEGVELKPKIKLKRPLFPYLATSKCKKVFIGGLFSCRSFAHLRSGQDKGLWGFSAARGHLQALSSCSSFSSSQWSQSQTFCRSQSQTHCWSGHAWDRKGERERLRERETGIRTFCGSVFCLHTQNSQRHDKKRSCLDRDRNAGGKSGLEIFVFPNQSWANTQLLDGL